MQYKRGIKPSGKFIQHQLIKAKEAIEKVIEPQKNREKRETL